MPSPSASCSASRWSPVSHGRGRRSRPASSVVSTESPPPGCRSSCPSRPCWRRGCSSSRMPSVATSASARRWWAPSSPSSWRTRPWRGSSGSWRTTPSRGSCRTGWPWAPCCCSSSPAEWCPRPNRRPPGVAERTAVWRQTAVPDRSNSPFGTKPQYPAIPSPTQLEPAGPLEEHPEPAHRHDHEEDGVEVAVVPAQLRHVGEVHTVDTGDQRGSGDQADAGRDLAHVLVLLDRDLGQMGGERGRQQLVEPVHGLGDAGEVIQDVAEERRGLLVDPRNGAGCEATHRIAQR